MKSVNIIFAILCGLVVGLLISDVLEGLQMQLPWYGVFLIWVSLPILSIIGLQIARQIGNTFLVVYQAAKHLLVGAAVTVIDLKFFELFLLLLPMGVIVPKAISFILAALLKYLGNKFWVFKKNDTEDAYKEFGYFLIIAIVGLVIDVTAFWYLIIVINTPDALPEAVWRKASVLIAALIAVIWNFLGIKFLVFKK